MDNKLQKLKRASAFDPDARVRLLRARKRAGELTRNNIALAAYLGDEACEEIEGYTDPTFMDHIAGICHCGWCELEQEGFIGCLVRLIQWGQETIIRASIAAAQKVFRVRTAACMASQITLDCECGEIRNAIEAAECWIMNSSEENRETCVHLWHSNFAHDVLFGGVLFLIGLHDEQPRLDAFRVLITKSVHLTSKDEIQAAIKRELVPWALGDSDIIKERVNDSR